jgi:DNA-binding XRE family transcriptional regulator
VASDVEKNVSCGELAQKLGITHQAMSKFISGQKAPSLWRLHTIADALGVRVRDLFV